MKKTNAFFNDTHLTAVKFNSMSSSEYIAVSIDSYGISQILSGARFALTKHAISPEGYNFLRKIAKFVEIENTFHSFNFSTEEVHYMNTFLLERIGELQDFRKKSNYINPLIYSSVVKMQSSVETIL